MSAAPLRLDVERARARVRRIREALAFADTELLEAHAAKEWRLLGHASWESYVAAELPALRMLRITREERQAHVVNLTAGRMPRRAVAAALDISLGQVQKDLENAGVVVPLRRPAPTETRAQTVLGLLAAAGERGLTSTELDAKVRWPMGTTTSTLSKLERRGLARRNGTFRNQRGCYVV